LIFPSRSMLESQDRRTISLVDVVEICRKESEAAQLQGIEATRSCSDSGISSSANSEIKVSTINIILFAY
jgi:hypothetical protein